MALRGVGIYQLTLGPVSGNFCADLAGGTFFLVTNEASLLCLDLYHV